jgi:hypothetical protein
MIKMKKNWIFAVIFVVTIIPQAIMGIFALGDEGVPDLTRLMPVYSLIFDSLYLYMLSPIIMMIFIQYFTIIISIGFYKLHITVKLKKYDYFIFNDIEKTKESHFLVIIKRAVTLGLLSLSIGLFLSEIIPDDIIVSSDIAGTITPIQLVTNTGLFILPFLILILGPIWLLRDSGIMCRRSKINKEKRQLPDIEGIYNYFESNITGYVGIGAIISLIVLLFASINALNAETGELSDIPGIFLTPLWFTIMTFPAITFYELRLRSMREKLVSRLSEKGLQLVDKIDVSLTNN